MLASICRQLVRYCLRRTEANVEPTKALGVRPALSEPVQTIIATFKVPRRWQIRQHQHCCVSGITECWILDSYTGILYYARRKRSGRYFSYTYGYGNTQLTFLTACEAAVVWGAFASVVQARAKKLQAIKMARSGSRKAKIAEQQRTELMQIYGVSNAS